MSEHKSSVERSVLFMCVMCLSVDVMYMCDAHCLVRGFDSLPRLLQCGTIAWYKVSTLYLAPQNQWAILHVKRFGIEYFVGK